MPIALASNLVPKGGEQFFLLDDTLLRGGYRVVAFQADMLAVPKDSLKLGSLCYVQADRKFFLWEYEAGVTAWREWKPWSSSTPDPGPTPTTDSVYDAYDVRPGWVMGVDPLGVKSWIPNPVMPSATLWMTNDVDVPPSNNPALSIPFGDCEEHGQTFWSPDQPTRIQIVETGRYQVDSALCYLWTSQPAFVRQRMHLNGETIPHDLTGRVSQYIQSSSEVGPDMSSTSGIMSLKAGDYLELKPTSTVQAIVRCVKRCSYVAIRRLD